MSLLYIEGFDHITPTEIAEKGWSILIGYYVSWEAPTGRFGFGKSIYFNQVLDWGVYGGSEIASTLSRVVNNKQVLIVGYALYPTLMSGITNHNFLFLDNTTIQLQVKMDLYGKLYFINGSGSILTDTLSSNIRLKFNEWNFIEIKATISNSISSNSCVIKINEQEVCNLAAGQDTQATANSYSTIVKFSGLEVAIDDFYLCDNLGSTNNDFLGDNRVATLFPSSNGNYSQFVGSDSNSTDNYLLVDENPKNTTDYVTSYTLNAIDSYSFGNFLQTATNIKGIQVANHMIKTDVGFRKVTSLVRISNVDYLGTETAITPTWVCYTNLFELDPSINDIWQQSAIDNAEFGFKITT